MVIEPLLWPVPQGDVILPACEAIVARVEWAQVLRARVDVRRERPALVVSLADGRPVSEDVSTLAQHADLLVNSQSPGSLVLAAILALVRWRGP